MAGRVWLTPDDGCVVASPATTLPPASFRVREFHVRGPQRPPGAQGPRSAAELHLWGRKRGFWAPKPATRR
jgi:hypothetical protein